MAATGNSVATEREFVIRRCFDAPRELVWQAWTQPDRVLCWLVDTPFAALEFEMNGEPGAPWHSRIRSPEGKEYVNSGVVREAVEPERLVFTFVSENDNCSPCPEMVITLALAKRDDGTEMTFRQALIESREDTGCHNERQNS